MTDAELDELRIAGVHKAMKELGQCSALVIGWAAEAEPDILRTALRKVFDLSAIEDTTQRMNLHVKSSWLKATECRELVASIEEQLNEIERTIDYLNIRLDKAREIVKTFITNGKTK